MCGSTERPETLDTQEYRFKRGDRVRATRDHGDLGRVIEEGWVGTYDDIPGDGIPYVNWDGQGRRMSREDALEAESVAEAPRFTLGQAVRITGNTSSPHHHLRIGEVGKIVGDSASNAPDVKGVHRDDGTRLTQYVSVVNLEPVVEEALEPAVGATVRITGNTNPRHGYAVGTLAVIEKAPDGALRWHGRERYDEAWFLREKEGTMHQHVHADDFELVEETPAQPEPLAAALAHIPPRSITGESFPAWPINSDTREATVEVFGEPTTEEVRVQSVNELREGDVVTVAPSAGTPRGELVPVFVRREVLAAPEPVKPAPGTFGTAVIDGRRRKGFVDDDGEFAYPDDNGASEWSSDFSDFVPDSDAPALPDAETLGLVLRDTRSERDETMSWTEDAEIVLRAIRG